MKIKSLAVTKYFFEPLVSYYHSDDIDKKQKYL